MNFFSKLFPKKPKAPTITIDFWFKQWELKKVDGTYLLSKKRLDCYDMYEHKIFKTLTGALTFLDHSFTEFDETGKKMYREWIDNLSENLE